MFMNIEQSNLKMSLRPERKKKPLFYGQRALPSRIGWWERSFFNIFSFWCNNDPPKKIFKKFCSFTEKNFRKYFQLFSKTFSQIFLDFGQNWLISQDFSKLKRKKRKTFQTRKSGLVGPVKQRVFSYHYLS